MKILVAILTIGLCAANGYSFGPRAHRLVGAVAERRIADSKNVRLKRNLALLLDGMTLEAVSTLPDTIRSWDPPFATASQADSFRVTGRPRIEAELRAFVKANTGRPSHQQFHYTEVPVFGGEKYGSGTVGRSEFDIVKIISFCIGVLKGQIPEKNERAITKSVAVILLVHLLADIHQPLHVGAQYFSADGMPVRPTPQNQGFEDQAGNKLNLFLREKQLSVGRLHGFWDGTVVEIAFGRIPDQKVVAELAVDEPKGWRLNSPPENWGETLADEVLPLAGEAYARLEYKNIKIVAGSRTIVSGNAVEKSTAQDLPYDKWASQTVKQQIHKAGWRLAALLEATLQ